MSNQQASSSSGGANWIWDPHGSGVYPNTSFIPSYPPAETTLDHVWDSLQRLEAQITEIGARITAGFEDVSDRLSKLEINELQDLERDLREAA